MPDTINLDLSNPDLAPLKDKAVGDTCDLTGLKVEVTANDGKTLSGNIVEAELGDEYSDASDTQEAPAEKPTAVAAVEMGGKKKPAM